MKIFLFPKMLHTVFINQKIRALKKEVIEMNEKGKRLHFSHVLKLNEEKLKGIGSVLTLFLANHFWTLSNFFFSIHLTFSIRKQNKFSHLEWDYSTWDHKLHPLLLLLACLMQLRASHVPLKTWKLTKVVGGVSIRLYGLLVCSQMVPDLMIYEVLSEQNDEIIQWQTR